MTAIPLAAPPDATEPIPLESAYARIRTVLEAITASETIPLGETSDRILAADIHSPMPLPIFDNAAVDGYGIHRDDLGGGRRLEVVGRATAGIRSTRTVTPGQALYLATGAVVAAGVDAVVMHEKTIAAGSGIVVQEPLVAGANIRRSGEDVPQGSVIVEAGTLLDYRHAGLLASAGVASVPVRPRIRIVLVSTGDEVRSVGEALAPGQIYDVNGPMLSSLLTRGFIELVATPRAIDDDMAIAALLRAYSADADLIITTGGAAGSDSDYALRSILNAGGHASALRMALRPGKPIVFGKIGSCAVLSLPGNPLAALINFLLFARPAILALAGQDFRKPRGQAALAAEEIVHTAGRTEFAPARIVGFAEDGRPLVVRIGRGGSARLKPLAEADGFIELNPDSARVPALSPLQFHPFKASFAP